MFRRLDPLQADVTPRRRSVEAGSSVSPSVNEDIDKGRDQPLEGDSDLEPRHRSLSQRSLDILGTNGEGGLSGERHDSDSTSAEDRLFDPHNHQNGVERAQSEKQAHDLASEYSATLDFPESRRHPGVDIGRSSPKVRQSTFFKSACCSTHYELDQGQIRNL